MPVNYLFITLISFLTGAIFTGLLKKFSLKYRILAPQGIPLIGGLSLWLSFVLGTLSGSLLYGSLGPQAKGIIFASLIMLIFGVIDDRWELSIFAKFLVQIIATVLLIFSGIRAHIVYIGDILNIMITLLWVIGITNALNHLDITDGLGGGTAIIVSLSLFIISMLNSDMRTAILSLALSAAVAGFLIYNLPPAKVYMGNSGSHFLGFVLASIALIISYAPMERKIALLSPILVLGFPILDTVSVILIRINKKKSPFKKSNDHLVLRFLALGYSQKKALLVMLAWSLFFSLCGIIISKAPNPASTVIVSLVVFASLILIIKMSKVAQDA